MNTWKDSTRRRKRIFHRNQRNKKTTTTRVVVATQEEGTQDEPYEIELPDIRPINLTDIELTDAQNSLLAKGPSFCPTPKDINWLKVQKDLGSFERRVRIAAYFAYREQKVTSVVSQLPEVPKKSKWIPPKVSSEVELFLEKVRTDILDPGNIRKPEHNLKKEEGKL